MCPTWTVCESISALNWSDMASGGGTVDGRWWKRPAVAFRLEQQPWRNTSAAAESKKMYLVYSFLKAAKLL